MTPISLRILQRRIALIERRGTPPAGWVPTGHDGMDQALGGGLMRGCLARHQRHRLRAGLPPVVEQQRPRDGAERQRVGGGPRGGVAGQAAP
ncbi:MAG: hypothetical protein K2X31_04640 [Sphingopyxis sp.]|nr:hypothetical protein [Sphingopyxis sp.]